MFSSQANIQCRVPSVSFIHDYFVPSIMSGTEEKMTSKRSFWPWPWLSFLEHHPLDLRVANSIPAQGICEKLPIGFSSSLSLSLPLSLSLSESNETMSSDEDKKERSFCLLGAYGLGRKTDIK